MFSFDPRSLKCNDHIKETDELRDDALQLETIHLPRGSSTRSILHCRNWISGKRKRTKRRKTKIFFTPLDPFNSDADEAESVTNTTKPRKVKYQMRWRPEQDAVYWIHLSTAQDAGLEFFQTGSNAISTYQSVPKECVVKVVSESVKRELFARQLTPRERPEVTLRPSWVHTRSNTVSMSRETESNVQAWNFDPNASGSRTWQKEEMEQSIDLRIDGILNDETHTDEQYMQRIAEQVQKLETTKEFSNRRLTQGQHSQWEGREKNSWSRQLWVTWNSAKN